MNIYARKFRLLQAVIILLVLVTEANAQQPASKIALPDDFCIYSNELLLAKSINDYRRENNLQEIPYSFSLFFVARTHVQDLTKNHPDVLNCNEHSWSDKGDWKACCYSKESGKTSCMTDKPKEIAGYKGKGYEMVYWDSQEAIPSDALELWKSIPLTNDMLLSQGKWKTIEWKSCGVGILQGYASVWFGDVNDHLYGIRLCQNDSVIDRQQGTTLVKTNIRIPRDISVPSTENESMELISVPVSTQKYFHLIVGSYKTRKQAGAEVATLLNKGYPEARVIAIDSIFRVSIAEYTTMSAAEKAIHRLTSTFKGIWILK